MKNKTLWDSVKKTDIRATKNAKVGGRHITSINGYSMIEKATEKWGPMGQEWWFEIDEDYFTDGLPIVQSINEVEQIVGHEKMHTIKVKLFYPNCKNPVYGIGHTPYIYKSKYGATCDMEAPKKSMTDAQKKALSMLGFCTDVFMGEFEDVNYLEILKNEQKLEEAENKEAEAVEQAKAYTGWLDSHLSLISTSKNINELEKLFILVARKCRRYSDPNGEKAAVLAKDKRKKELEVNENVA